MYRPCEIDCGVFASFALTLMGDVLCRWPLLISVKHFSLWIPHIYSVHYMCKTLQHHCRWFHKPKVISFQKRISISDILNIMWWIMSFCIYKYFMWIFLQSLWIIFLDVVDLCMRYHRPIEPQGLDLRGFPNPHTQGQHQHNCGILVGENSCRPQTTSLHWMYQEILCDSTSSCLSDSICATTFFV